MTEVPARRDPEGRRESNHLCSSPPNSTSKSNAAGNTMRPRDDDDYTQTDWWNWPWRSKGDVCNCNPNLLELKQMLLATPARTSRGGATFLGLARGLPGHLQIWCSHFHCPAFLGLCSVDCILRLRCGCLHLENSKISLPNPGLLLFCFGPSWPEGSFGRLPARTARGVLLGPWCSSGQEQKRNVPGFARDKFRFS